MNRSTRVSAVPAVVLALCVLAPCGLGSCGSPEQGPPALVWWMVGSTQPGFDEHMRTLSDYAYEHAGVRFEIKLAGWADSNQRFTTMINAGEYFDIMFTDGSNYNRFNELGAFADLTELLPAEAPELYGYIPPVLWEGVKIRGRVYAVPTYKDSSVTGYYFWDHRYVEQYNIDLTRTDFAYLDEVFRRMKAGEANPRFYPLVLARSSNSFIFEEYDGLSANLEPVGVKLDDTGRRVVSVLEQADVLEKLRYLHAWYEDGIINPDANMNHEVTKGRPFFMAQAWPSVALSYAISEGVEQYDSVRFFGPVYSTASIQGSMNVISANSKYKAEALKLLELVNTDPRFRDMLHLGIEGVHFEYVQGGAAAKRLRTDWPLSNYQEGTYFIETPLDTFPPGYWDEARSQNEAAVPSVMLGFMMDIAPVMNEVITCRSIWERYKQDLITGASDPDETVPRLLSELHAGGFDTIMAEARRQAGSF